MPASIARGLALAVCALTLATPASSRAETYGEVGGFTGPVGAGHGQFKIKAGTHAFGVDPTDNSVYVGDEPKAGEYRIQKLTASGAFLAQTATFKPPNHDGIEGIAIDPALKRVYVLALEKRGTALTISPSAGAAGTLYAFSTEPSGEALAPASGTNTEGVLTGPGALEPQSDASEVALLEPKGITVDPTTHDVIVLGEVEAKTEEEKEPHFHVALERIHSGGATGERYVDSTDFFAELAPNSPVVSPKGDVYVAEPQPQTIPGEEAGENELIQIPTEFASTALPTPFVQFPLRGKLEEESRAVVELEDNETTNHGGGLSFAPEGEGTIDAKAHVFVGNSLEGAYYPGVLAFNATDGAEIGWTGGQTKKSGTACALNFGGRTYSSVAAGKDRTVFVFDPGKESPSIAPRVVEFGPGGTGCPAAEASEPLATVNGQPLSPSEPISAGTEVAFSSTMTQANALSVEWSFGDGQTATVSTDEFEHTAVKHKFTQGGELTITETIHTDDLATPTIVKTTKIKVSATAPPPSAVLEGPTEIVLGGGAIERLVYLEDGGLELVDTPSHGEASFDASASSASTSEGANRIVAYHWTFGDGHSETTSTATVEHTYERADAYKVELTVTDAHGLTSEPATLTVEVKNAPEPLGAKGGAANTPAGTVAAVVERGPAAGKPLASEGHRPPPVPDVLLKATKLKIGRLGAVALQLACAGGDGSCTGTVTLRTLGAIGARTADSAQAKKKREPVTLTLAVKAFTIAGGRTKTVTLRLTSRAHALLARARVLRARVSIVVRDPAGTTHTTQTAVTLRAQ